MARHSLGATFDGNDVCPLKRELDRELFFKTCFRRSTSRPPIAASEMPSVFSSSRVLYVIHTRQRSSVPSCGLFYSVALPIR
jgi:hypothetical protein